jgi:hypothetical protein
MNYSEIREKLAPLLDAEIADDETKNRILDGLDDALASQCIVDIRFTAEGISIVVHDENGWIDRRWFTWDDVHELRNDDESCVTFEL